LSTVTEVAELRIVVRSSRMPHTSQLWRVHRGIEELYYALLFARSGRYPDAHGAWRTWSEMGSSVGLREAPPAARREDRPVMSLRSDGKTVTVTASGGDPATVEQLARVVRRIAELRPGISGATEVERAEQLLADDELAADFRTPVAESMRAAALPAEDAERLGAMIRRDLAALVYPDITAVDVTGA
jgi:hypothetical protein